MQDKLKRGLQAQTRDMLGFDLTAAPPEMNSLNSSLKETLFRSMNKLLEQQDIREQQWLACQRPSHTWPFLQLLQDSWHLLKQAGDNLLLVGIVTTPQETSLKTKKSFLNRVKDKISRAIDKLFRMSPYQAQHATYAAVVPDYAKVALLLKELSNIYHNNPAVFPSADVFLRAAESLFDTLQTQFYSPQAVPPAVRKRGNMQCFFPLQTLLLCHSAALNWLSFYPPRLMCEPTFPLNTLIRVSGQVLLPPLRRHRPLFYNAQPAQEY